MERTSHADHRVDLPSVFLNPNPNHNPDHKHNRRRRNLRLMMAAMVMAG